MDSVPAAALQKLSPCDVAALQKCLKENDGKHEKCLEEINAFQRACGQVKKTETLPPPQQSAQPAAPACDSCSKQ